MLSIALIQPFLMAELVNIIIKLLIGLATKAGDIMEQNYNNQ